jgi:triacylglycerol esterase/lipase EstA (alpha/beta hydrolase family)
MASMWTALTLWVLNVGGLAIYAALAARAVAAGGRPAPWIAGAVLIYFGVVLFLCAAYFAIAWIWRARRPHGARIGWRRTLRLLWREYATLAGAAPRMMLYALLMRDPAPARVDVPVLLVHGVLCNAGVWIRLARFLARRGVAGVYSLSYGPPLASIEVFADQLASKIDAVLAATGARRVVVVAHSMGGLVARADLRKHGARKLARVLTIGAPHHGSMHAWLFPGVSLAQLRPGNAWLAVLNRERLDASLRFVSLWSWHDSMVAPQTSCELPGAVDAPLVGVGHNALLGDPRVFAQVLDEIEAARRPAIHPSPRPSPRARGEGAEGEASARG